MALAKSRPHKEPPVTSLRANWMKRLIRKTVKPLLSPETTIETQRFLADIGLQLNVLPKGTHIVATEIAGRYAEWVSHEEVSTEHVVLYFHGGAYNIGSAKSHRNLTAHLAKAMQCPILVLDYRLAPEHPFPAALSDATSAYQWLLDHDHEPEHIAIAGDSAGAGLVMATALELKQRNLPMPAVLGAISPWVDMTMSGESVTSKAELDPMIRKDWLDEMINNYAIDVDPASPLCSPIFADLAELPPIFIQVGSDEILLDDAVRLAQRAEATGTPVELQIWEDMWHVWHFQAGILPESDQAIEEFANALKQEFVSKGFE